MHANIVSDLPLTSDLHLFADLCTIDSTPNHSAHAPLRYSGNPHIRPGGYRNPPVDYALGDSTPCLDSSSAPSLRLRLGLCTLPLYIIRPLPLPALPLLLVLRGCDVHPRPPHPLPPRQRRPDGRQPFHTRLRFAGPCRHARSPQCLPTRRRSCTRYTPVRARHTRQRCTATRRRWWRPPVLRELACIGAATQQWHPC